MSFEQLADFKDKILTALGPVEQTVTIALAVTEIGVTAKHLAYGTISAEPFTCGFQRLEHFLIIASGVRILALPRRLEPTSLGNMAKCYSKFGGGERFIEAPCA